MTPAKDLFDAAPPHDLTAERGLLAAVLVQPALMDEVERAGIRAAHFHDPAHRALFARFEELQENGHAVEPLALRSLSQADGDDGSVALMAELVRGGGSAANWRYYADQLIECDGKRRLRWAGEQLLIASANGVAPAAAAADAVRDLAKLAESDGATKAMRGIIRRLADVQAVPVQWLWPARIALGKLTIIAGDPGLGKSFLSIDLAARISTGTKWPDCAECAPQGGVVLMNAEDDAADTVRPRLDAAGADVTRVVMLDAVRWGDGERSVDLSRDLPALEEAITQVGDCRLVVIDPISAYLGGTDSHKNAEVRSVLAPLGELAARHGVAVLGVTHLRKGEGAAIYKTMGSLAFVAAARAAWAVTKDDADEKRRLFVPMKNNLGNDRTGLAFTLSARHSGPVPCVEWFADAVTVSADEALTPPKRQRGPAPEGRDEATDFLRGALANGPRLAKEVIADASEGYGISKRTLDRARNAAGVEAYRDVVPGPWWWRLVEPPE